MTTNAATEMGNAPGCPVCADPMDELDMEGVVVDVCRAGCGVWFDSFELREFDEAHEGRGDVLAMLEAREAPRPQRPDRIFCPRHTGRPMIRRFWSVKRGVELDECPSCAGVWLDAGELADLRRQFDTEAERKEAAEAVFGDLFGDDLARMRAETEEGTAWARKFAHALRFICPSYYMPGKQDWGAF